MTGTCAKRAASAPDAAPGDARRPRLLGWLIVGALCADAELCFALTDQERAQAASTTATSAAACTALSKFYWEIGDRNSRLASGTWGNRPPAATDQLAVYSASKWVYGAYVYERRGGVLNADDLRSLRMLDGYTETRACLLYNTVGSCQSAMGSRDTTAVDKYYYASGHFQKHAAIDLGLASKTTSTLATEIHNYLGNDWVYTYRSPDLAGGGKTSATDYGKFLRKILNGTLLLSGSALGSNAVCTYTGPTDPQTGHVHCGSALNSPSDEAWDYSIGHWVETDPVWLASGGDAAYSSPGTGGFYPWIDASRTYYGVLAREDVANGAGGASASCGRLIRKAWLTGTPQP